MSSILNRIAAGDDSAVADCLREYGGLVWRLANRYLDRVKDQVEDAVQEVFVEVWLSAGRYDPARGSEASWIATIAHRRLIDYQRRETTRWAAARKIEAKPTGDSDPITPLARALSAHDLSSTAEAFDRLPADERRALWMSIHNGMSHRQIAEATEAPIGTIKTRLRRGLARLHDALTPDHPEKATTAGGAK